MIINNCNSIVISKKYFIIKYCTVHNFIGILLFTQTLEFLFL